MQNSNIELLKPVVELQNQNAKNIDRVDIRERSFAIARYTQGSAQSIPNTTLTVINYETVAADPANLVTTGAGWQFTAPIDGYYHVEASLMYSHAASAGERFRLAVNRNGGLFSYIDDQDSFVGGARVMLKGSDVVKLSLNDTLDVRTWHNVGTSLNTIAVATISHVAIFLI